MKLRLSLLAACLLTSAFALAETDDFPTLARVEYVIQCMSEHGGQNYDTLYPCVCVIDKIDAQLSYDIYNEAETFTRGRRTPGERGSVFRDPPQASKLRKQLAEVKQAAEASCFVKRAGPSVR